MVCIQMVSYKRGWLARVALRKGFFFNFVRISSAYVSIKVLGAISIGSNALARSLISILSDVSIIEEKLGQQSVVCYGTGVLAGRKQRS